MGPVYVSGQNGDGTVMLFKVEDEEEVTVLEGVESYSLSGNGEKVLYSAGGALGIADLAEGQDAAEGRLELGQHGITCRSEGRVAADVRRRVAHSA